MMMYAYFAYLCLGLAALWPWNCFLSASAYFQNQLSSSPTLAACYPSAMMTISTLTATLCNYFLTKLPKLTTANYARLVHMGNAIQFVLFTILTLTAHLTPPPLLYFSTLMIAIALSSAGTCFVQVGTMAIVNTQDSIYANATVVGNAIAGVLPSIAMLLATTASPTSTAVRYFLTSVLVALISHAAILLVDTTSNKDTSIEFIDDSIVDLSPIKPVLTAMGLALAVSLVFPVFAASTTSDSIPVEKYVPLAFLAWNAGDLAGRVLCLHNSLCIANPKSLVFYGIARLAFIPILLLCFHHWWNDFTYMTIQFLFGATNGHLFSCAYMRVGGLLKTEREQHAAAAVTALVLNGGLLVGSLGSFVVAWVVHV